MTSGTIRVGLPGSLWSLLSSMCGIPSFYHYHESRPVLDELSRLLELVSIVNRNHSHFFWK